MENFIYNDNFYSDLSELADTLESDDELTSAPDDTTWEIELTDPEKIVEFNADWILERIDEERFTEDGADKEMEKIVKALNQCIDWKKLNSMIPIVHYVNNKKMKVSKQDLLDSI